MKNKTDFEEQLDSSLDAARSSLAKKAKRLAEAERILAEKQQAAKKLHREDADDKALRAAEAAVRDEQDHFNNIVAAIAEVEQDVGRLERSVAEAADRKVRAATAAEVEKIAEQLTAAADNFTRAAAELAAISGIAATFSMDCQGLHALATTLRNDLPQTMATPIAMVRAHAVAVLAGGAPATLPQPALVALPAPPPAPRVDVISIENVAFHDGNVVRTVHPGYKISLLPAVASAALKAGAVCQPSDPRARHHELQRKPTVPELSNCVPLDDAARRAIAAAAADPRGNVVQPIRRSPPPGVVDASRPPQLAAMRSVDSHGNEFELTPGKPYSVSIPRETPQPGGKKDE